LKTSAGESPAKRDAGDLCFGSPPVPNLERGRKMTTKLLLLAAVAILGLSLAACNEGGTNTNERANANANTNTSGPLSMATPTATPKYSAEQAREERARAKENKETIGDTLDDAWIHAKIVAKLIGDSKTPERKINVDVVNNDVTLRGTVDTAEAKAEAERIAKETDGVKKVVNQLKVVAPKPANPSKAANTNKGNTKY
jgi:osmotically-inducible protein OsmY